VDSGTIVTAILATVILGYGAYIVVKSIKRTKEGKCVSCSGCSHGASCSSYKK